MNIEAIYQALAHAWHTRNTPSPSAQAASPDMAREIYQYIQSTAPDEPTVAGAALACSGEALQYLVGALTAYPDLDTIPFIGLGTTDEILQPYKHVYDYRAKHGHIPKIWLDTGYSSLDTHLKITPGRIYIIGGRPGSGKTTLSINLLAGILKNQPDACGVMVSCEMPVQDIINKLYASNCRIALDDILAGYICPNDLHARALTFLERLQIGDYTVAETIQYASNPRVRVLVIDYIQIFGMGESTTQIPKHLQIEQLAMQLKRVAIEYDTAIILCAQLRRESKEMKDSGSLEQVADGIILIDSTGICSLTKNRFSKCITDLGLEFNKNHQLFIQEFLT